MSAPSQLVPKCPHCNEQPIRMCLTHMVFPNDIIGSILYCGNPDCCKMLSALHVGVQPAAVESVIKKIQASKVNSV